MDAHHRLDLHQRLVAPLRLAGLPARRSGPRSTVHPKPRNWALLSEAFLHRRCSFFAFFREDPDGNRF
jgi:hypothetical protein